MDQSTPLPIFPLAGALLFPGGHLPLHIFEPRYRDMVADAMAGQRLIGMIQPRDDEDDTAPALFSVGCIGRIVDCTELEDGRYNIVLEGLARFTIVREIDADTPYRQVIAEWQQHDVEDARAGISHVLRHALEDEARRFADLHGYQVDWPAVAQLDDETLVHLIAQVAPFDSATKQSLLEAPTLENRAGLLIQFMEFFRAHMARGGDQFVTLQ